MSISMKVTGDKELIKKFKKLEASVQYDILKEGTEQGARIVRGDARSRIRSRTGKLRKRIKIRSKKIKMGIETEIYSDIFYSKMVELGHSIVVKTREGKKIIGHVSGKPFLTPAFESRRSEVLSAIEFKIKQRILKVAR